MASVAISIDVCSLLTAGAMEEGGRSNASSPCGGVGDGGRSCPISTREVLLDNLRAAFEASEEKHVAIRGCDRKWPFDLTYRKRSWTSPEAPLVGMRLLVIGSTLGGYVIDFPCSILEKYVVLMLQKNRGQLQYGYRSMAYNSGEDGSWTGDTDMSPVCTFWNLYDGLVDLGMDPVMSMIGMSAGVDRCLAVLAHAEEVRRRHRFTCTHFVSICGAFHPFLYERAKEVFILHRCRVIVVHHQDDWLCKWPPVQAAWQEIREGMSRAGNVPTVYIAKLYMKTHPYLDGSRHAVEKFVVYQNALWLELAMGPYSSTDNFVDRCRNAKLGLGHITPPEEQSFKDLVLFTSPRDSHILMYSQILLSVLPIARQAGSTEEYLRIVVKNIREYLSPRESKRTMELLRMLRAEHKVLVYRYGLWFLADGPSMFLCINAETFPASCFSKCISTYKSVFSGCLKHIDFISP